jgi:hypothetical protein
MLPIGWNPRSSPPAGAWPNIRKWEPTKREDITALPVRLWTVTKYRNYVVVYRPETVPLQVIAVLHGVRDLKHVLADRRVP